MTPSVPREQAPKRRFKPVSSSEEAGEAAGDNLLLLLGGLAVVGTLAFYAFVQSTK